MKKYLLIASGLLLSSPLVLAQNTPQPSVPSTPAIPAEPATPATPADPTKKDTTTKDKKATNKAKSDGGSATGNLGGAVDPNAKSGSAKGGASGKGDFASFDANGDGSLSQDEVKADTSIKFKDLDRNSDGKVSRGEYESSVNASPNSSQNQDTPDKAKDKVR